MIAEAEEHMDEATDLRDEDKKKAPAEAEAVILSWKATDEAEKKLELLTGLETERRLDETSEMREEYKK